MEISESIAGCQTKWGRVLFFFSYFFSSKKVMLCWTITIWNKSEKDVSSIKKVFIYSMSYLINQVIGEGKEQANRIGYILNI